MTLDDIPLDDENTWKAFKTCNTKGVFQFSSPLALSVLKKMQCGNMEELAAANSFIRPGTGGLDDYVKGKRDRSTIKVLDPRLNKWLEVTYGAIVFQEQVMGLISELMGISFGQADIYRRALEKMHKAANREKVNYFNDNVVKIAKQRGFKEEEAEYIRKLIIDNCGYLFNKSHAVCYSYISYYTAWMKVNYPLIFHKTMLNGNLDNLGEFIDLARDDNIKLKTPHVNYSFYDTTIESEIEKSLRIGFNSINGVGAKAVEGIVLNRPYNIINDFFEKNNSKTTNKKVVESLINSGSFDDLGIEINKSYVSDESLISMGFDLNSEGNIVLNKKQLQCWYKYYIEASSPKTIPNYEVNIGLIKNKYIDQYDLVEEKDSSNVVIPEIFLSMLELTVNSGIKTRKKPKGILKTMLDEEKGTSDSFTKPFIKHGKEIASIKINQIDLYLEDIDLYSYSFIEHPLQKYANKITVFGDAKDGDLCIEAGIITALIPRKTKNDKTFYWLMLRTPLETIKIQLWENQYKRYKNLIKQYALVAVKGTKGYGGIGLTEMKTLQR